MTSVAPTITFGVTIHSQTGEEVKIHDVGCRHYARGDGSTKNRRELTAEEAVAWLRDRPNDVCGVCIKRPARDVPDNVETPEGVNHIVAPAKLMNDVAKGKDVKAVCGQMIRHKSKPKLPICRKCFNRHFGTR